MIICVSSHGDHSNRLFQNIHFEGFCLENNIAYSNPSFKDMEKYYNSGLNTEGSLYMHILGKLQNKIKISRKIVSFDSPSDEYASVLLEKAHNEDIYVRGWGFRVFDLTKKYQDTFIKKYKLKHTYYADNEFYNTAINEKKSRKTLIGIHIRRGDYKTYKGGKFYFDDDIYRGYMESIKKLPEIRNTDIVFIIFSDTKTGFINTEDTLVSKENWYIDHLIMSECDFLVGPPSTFTLWASYIGKTRYCHIDGRSEVAFRNFKYCYG